MLALSLAGSLPFVSSLDHMVPLEGPGLGGPLCAQREFAPALSTLHEVRGDLKIAVAGECFAEMLPAESKAAVNLVADSPSAMLRDLVDDSDPNTNYRFLAARRTD